MINFNSCDGIIISTDRTPYVCVCESEREVMAVLVREELQCYLLK